MTSRSIMILILKNKVKDKTTNLCLIGENVSSESDNDLVSNRTCNYVSK